LRRNPILGADGASTHGRPAAARVVFTKGSGRAGSECAGPLLRESRGLRDTANGAEWWCSATNSWKKDALASGLGASSIKVIGSTGSAPFDAPATGNSGMLLYSTTTSRLPIDSAAHHRLRSSRRGGSHQFLTAISGGGIDPNHNPQCPTSGWKLGRQKRDRKCATALGNYSITAAGCATDHNAGTGVACERCHLLEVGETPTGLEERDRVLRPPSPEGAINRRVGGSNNVNFDVCHWTSEVITREL